MKTYLVGGAVRDQLLGLPVHERDWVVVGATPEHLLSRGYKAVGQDFPVFLHPVTKEEHALARTERKSGHGYAGFVFHASPDISLEDDLRRRDLTINAIAQDDHGVLYDPYHGQRDLESKILRHVSPAFTEDPLRVLRVARFAARYHHLGFCIADETLELMRSMVSSGEVDHLVAERIWQETRKSLCERSPAVFIRVLRDCGALARIMPEIDALFGVPQTAAYHPEIDAGEHILLCMQRISELTEELAPRFATLMHDLGKGVTPSSLLPKHHGHERAGLPLVKALCQRLKVTNECRDLALLVCEFHLHGHRAFELKASKLLSLLERVDVLRKPQRFEQFLLCCFADKRGRTGHEQDDYPQADFLRKASQTIKEVNINTLVEQGLSGAAIGEALRKQRLTRLKELQHKYETN